MGYACPVCEAPQADGEHLANHLAFTAMLHGGGDPHAAWLDEHVPDWVDRDPDGLAGAVVEYADAADHETVFDDTTGGRPDVDPRAVHRQDVAGGHQQEEHGALDPEARRIVQEAMEMSQRRSGGERSDDEDHEDDEER